MQLAKKEKKTCISLMSTKPSRLGLRSLLVTITTVLALSSLPVAEVTAMDSPEDTIRATANEVVSVLGDEALSLEEKTARLETYLDSGIDFETTSKLVMARNWRRFDEAERQEFVTLFRDYLINTYGSNIESYGGETVAIIGGRDEARGDYTVHTKIDRGGGEHDVFIDYRMRKDRSGNWRIIDVIAEGISMVSNLRSQFQEIVSNHGTAGLLERLRESTDKEGYHPHGGQQPKAEPS